MSMTPDRAYHTLGLDETTPRKALRKAYFRLALKHHPDKAKDKQAKDQANEKFRDIQSAYELLTQHHGEGSQPTVDSLRRDQAEPSHAWTRHNARAAKKADFSAYVDLDEEEETDDVRYGEEPDEEDERDSDDLTRSDEDESDEDGEAVWPTVEMRTTGYDKFYDEKYTISRDASHKPAIGDGVKDVAITAENEVWEDFSNSAENKWNVEPRTDEKATALDEPPTKSSVGHGEAFTSRIMPCGLPRVIGMTKEGLSVHEGEDADSIKLRGNFLTAARYNQLTRPQTAGRSIAKAKEYRAASLKINHLACQECFPETEKWTLEERAFNGKDPLCDDCKRKLESIVAEQMEEDVWGDGVSGVFIDDEEVEEDPLLNVDVGAITYEDAMATLAAANLDAATGEEMIL